MAGLSHQGMDHEIRRVCFDYLCRLWFAYDMTLDPVNMWNDKTGLRNTISAPSLALAIAEKYGAPV
jgi:hypothetical protein